MTERNIYYGRKETMPTFKDLEKAYIKDLMLTSYGSVTKAAKLSKISRAGLYRKLKQYELSPTWFKS